MSSPSHARVTVISLAIAAFAVGFGMSRSMAPLQAQLTPSLPPLSSFGSFGDLLRFMFGNKGNESAGPAGSSAPHFAPPQPGITGPQNGGAGSGDAEQGDRGEDEDRGEGEDDGSNSGAEQGGDSDQTGGQSGGDAGGGDTNNNGNACGEGAWCVDGINTNDEAKDCAEASPVHGAYCNDNTGMCFRCTKQKGSGGGSTGGGEGGDNDGNESVGDVGDTGNAGNGGNPATGGNPSEESNEESDDENGGGATGSTANDECAEDDCGPALGLPNHTCADGSEGGPTGRCVRKSANKCGWEIRQCPASGGTDDSADGSGTDGDSASASCDRFPGAFDRAVAAGAPCTKNSDCMLFQASCPMITCSAAINISALQSVKDSAGAYARCLRESGKPVACAGCQNQSVACINNRCAIGDWSEGQRGSRGTRGRHDGQTQTPEERAAMNTRHRNPGICQGASQWSGGGVSDDGKRIIFITDYDNLVGDVNGEGGLFLFDRETNVLKKISSFANGAAISPDGTYVQYKSGVEQYAPGLSLTCSSETATCTWTPDTTDRTGDVYEYDVGTGTSSRTVKHRLLYFALGVESFGSPVQSIKCQTHRLSDNGRFAICESYAALLKEDVNKRMDVYVFEVADPLGTLELVSRKNDDMLGACSWDNGAPSFTHNGQPVDGGTPPYKPFCGDGWLDQGEMCDDGDRNSDTESDACGTFCVHGFPVRQ